MNRTYFAVISGALLLISIAFIVWQLLNSIETKADWLWVESQRSVRTGESLPLRVHLFPQTTPCKMSVDLHWSKIREVSLGFLSKGGTKTVGRQGGSFDFSIPVTPKNGIRFVRAVIYLSPNGSWQDHTLVASSEIIPVNSPATQNQIASMETLKMNPSTIISNKHPQPLVFPRILTAFIFFWAAVCCHKGQSLVEGKFKLGTTNRCWQILSIALMMACLWELFDLETVLGDKVRALAKAQDLYHSREILQKAIISIVIAATTLFLIWVFMVRHSYQFLLACFGTYIGFDVVNLASLHMIDSIATLSWRGFTLIQLLKMICAVLTLHAIHRRLDMKNGYE